MNDVVYPLILYFFIRQTVEIRNGNVPVDHHHQWSIIINSELTQISIKWQWYDAHHHDHGW